MKYLSYSFLEHTKWAHTLALLLMLFVSADSWAQTYPYNGIYYKQIYALNEVNVEVAGPPSDVPGSDYAIGDVEIPKTVYPSGLGESTVKDRELQYISDYAFYGCTALEEVNASRVDDVKIGAAAFSRCSSLKTVSFGSVKSVEPGAFAYCDNLTSIKGFGTMINGVLCTDDSKILFWVPASMSGDDLVIPATVDSIAPRAFDGCSNIHKLTLHSNIKSIAENSVSVLDLDELYMTSMPIKVNESVFSSSQYENTKVFVPSGMIQYYKSDPIWSQFKNIIALSGTYGELPDYTFLYEDLAYRVTSNEARTVVAAALADGSNSTQKTVVVPEQIEVNGFKLRVTSLATNFMSNNTKVESVTIPASIVSIPDKCFQGCTNLESVNLPDNLLMIGNYVFEGCTKLSRFQIPSSLIYVGNGSFQKTSLTRFTPSSRTDLTIGSDAFAGCTMLNSVILTANNLTVGTNAFADCTSLESVSMNNGENLNLGSSAFAGCTALNIAYLPEGLTTISSGLFSGCTSLSTIVIPSTVTSVGPNAFAGCTGLQSISVNASVPPSASESSFSDDTYKIASLLAPASSLESYRNTQPWSKFQRKASNDNYESEFVVDGLYYSVTSRDRLTVNLIGVAEPLSGTVNVPGLIYHDGVGYTVEEIGDGAFGYETNCSSIATIRVSDGVKRITDRAFSGCTSLKSLTLPSTLKYFFVLSLLNTDLKSIVVEAQEPPSAIDAEYLDNKNIAEAWPTDATLYVPTGCKDAYENHYFWGRFDVKEGYYTGLLDYLDQSFEVGAITYTVTGPEEVECTGVRTTAGLFLTEVDIPETVFIDEISGEFTVKSIGKNAFLDLRYLERATLANTIESIDDYAFSGCYALTDITLPSGLLRLGHAVFEDCIALETIKLPGSITSAGNLIFNRCTALTTVDLPQNWKVLPSAIFKDCSSLKTVNLPDGLVRISTSDFRGCTSLRSIDLPQSIQVIQDLAFYGSGLQSVTLPSSLYDLGRGVFSDCQDLKSIFVHDLNTTFVIDGGHIYNADKTTLFQYLVSSEATSFELPTTVQNIPSFAFDGAHHLEEVTLPEGMISIDAQAFENASSLNRVTLPSTLIYIGDDAFRGCNINTVICNAINPPNTTAAFGPAEETQSAINFGYKETVKLLSKALLAVPANSVDAYKSHPVWSLFGKIKEYSATAIDHVEANSFSVQRTADGITLSGVEGSVHVYTTDGVRVYGSQDYNGQSIPLTGGRTYIIKTPTVSRQYYVR